MTRTCPHCMLPLPGRVYEAAGVRLDPETHQITVDGRPPQRKLARHEFIILSTLMRRPFMPFSVEVLLDQLGSTTRADDPLKYVQILVYRIRQVIGPSRIETLRGFGSYQMAREAPKPVLPGYADHLIRKPDGQANLMGRAMTTTATLLLLLVCLALFPWLYRRTERWIEDMADIIAEWRPPKRDR